MKRSLKFRLVFLIVCLFVLYGAGVIIRSRSGIRVVIQNQTGKRLQYVSVKLEHEKQYSIGEMNRAERKRIFVKPAGGDSIRLEFTDGNNLRHDELVAGYVEGGYCGDVKVQVFPDGRVDSLDKSFALYNWRSWLSFL